MAVHFFEESPSPPDEQLARLDPPVSLLRAGIPCVVWAEDALSIVHRVPTCLFDQQLLVPDDCLEAATHAICSVLPYARAMADDESRWKDIRLFNAECPHSFDLNRKTILLKHHNLTFAAMNGKPRRIFIHAASVFHFDMNDPLNTCLNPSPPSVISRPVRFPTLAAFYDSLIATKYEPPLPHIHMRFSAALSSWLAYLSMYTVSDKGMTYYENKGDAESERVLIPACVDVLQKMKDENRPFLIREFFCMQPLEFEAGATERLILQRERCARMGIPPPPAQPIAYSPFYRSRGIPEPTEKPRLTPYLNQRTNGVEWRALAKYASIARRMLR